MVISHYNLQISYPENGKGEVFDHLISQILGIVQSFPARENKSSSPPVSWNLWKENVDDEYIDFITTFLDILEGKYEELEKIGIQRNNIVIFVLYRYYGQCNTEFEPEQLARLGINGIRLCISCWEDLRLEDSDSATQRC